MKRLHLEALSKYEAGRQFEYHVCRRPSASLANLRTHIVAHYRKNKYS